MDVGQSTHLSTSSATKDIKGKGTLKLGVMRRDIGYLQNQYVKKV